MELRGRGFLNTLSGRFLLLTMAFVMLAEVLIFVPSIARFRADYLLLRLEKAQIASLALLATDDAKVSDSLETELLKNAEVFNVVLRRDEVRQLALSSPIPQPISATYDLRQAGPWELIRDSAAVLMDGENRVIRVIGNPVQDAGLLIEITMETGPLRKAMVEYGLRILFLSALISAVTAFLLFLAVQRLLVAPIRRVVRHMTAYAEAPEDARRVITPSAGVVELRVAEEALAEMQTQLTGALRRKSVWPSLAARSPRSATICATSSPPPNSLPTGSKPAPTPPCRAPRRNSSAPSRAPCPCANRPSPSARPRNCPPSSNACPCAFWSKRWPKAKDWPAKGPKLRPSLP